MRPSGASAALVVQRVAAIATAATTAAVAISHATFGSRDRVVAGVAVVSESIREPARVRRDRVELEADVADRLPASSGILVETAAHEIDQPGMNIVRQGVQVRLAQQYGRHHFAHRVRLKCLTCRQHLEDDAPEREDVAALIGRQSLRLFRRHIGRGAEDDAGERAGQAQRR